MLLDREGQHLDETRMWASDDIYRGADPGAIVCVVPKEAPGRSLIVPRRNFLFLLSKVRGLSTQRKRGV